METAYYRVLRDRLGLTDSGVANLMGVDRSTAWRWSHRERSVPAPVSRFMRFLLAAGITPNDVLKALGERF